MSTIQEAYSNALLADATYALDANEDNVSGGALILRLRQRMTESVATYIAANFSIVTHIETDDVTGSGFDATVWRTSAGKLYVSMQGTEGLQDFLTDAQLALTGNGRDQIVDMVNWWFKITAPVGQAARQIKVDLVQVGMVNGVPVMQYQLAEAATVAGNGLVSAADLVNGIEVDGHSLGGYLASAFTRLFGAQAHVTHTTTFNSAGFAPGSEAVFQDLQSLIGIGYGIGRFPNQTEQTNYFAQHGINVATNSFWFSQVGRRVELFNEESATQVPNHYMYKLTDALALAAAMEKLDPGLTISRANALFEAGSDTVAASIEGVMNGLRRLLLDPKVGNIPVGDVSDSAFNRVTYHQVLKQLTDSDAFASLSGKVRIDPTAGVDLASKARNDFGALAGLLTLSPFVLTAADAASQSLLDTVLQGAWGSTYTDWQTDKTLSQADRDAGRQTYTDTYLNDREAMLQWVMVQNLKNEGSSVIIKNQPVSTNYTDIATGRTALLGTVNPNQRVQVIFGDAGNNPIDGFGKGDRLYGGAGTDTLNGLGGTDYLEGNAGDDTLNGGDGNDVLLGGTGADHLYGGADADTLLGGADGDFLYGEAGADVLRGGDGVDALDGGSENDQLEGGDGSDWLSGGAGNDRLMGEAGADIYSFDAGWGHDTIDDSDGMGSIVVTGLGAIDGIGAVKIADNAWQTPDKKFNYTLVGQSTGRNDLYISFSDRPDVITLRNWRSDKSVGITLSGTSGAVAPPAGTFVGDFIKRKDPGDPTVYLFGADGNYVSDGAQPGAADLITGSVQDDLIQGLAGNDALLGLTGDDWIEAGDGSDVLMGGLGRDTLIGGAGQDFIYGSSNGSVYYPGSTSYVPDPPDYATVVAQGFSWDMSSPGPDGDGFALAYLSNSVARDEQFDDAGNIIDAGAGDDTVLAGTGADFVHGGTGRDDIYGMAGSDVLFGDEGDDRIGGDGTVRTGTGLLIMTPGALHGADVIDGGAGNDILLGQGGADEIYGGSGDDKMWGDDRDIGDTPVDIAGDDYLDGGDGNDYLEGGGRADTLFGGDGADILFGDGPLQNVPGAFQGADYLDGEAGDDQLVGGGNDDELFGGTGNDQLWGDGAGSDVEAQGQDYLDGENGNDTLIGGGNNDELYGGDGNDLLRGDDAIANLATSAHGNDFLSGGAGNDTLLGDGGDDTLEGDDGDDVLAGGEGDDTLNGGAGRNSLYGDKGNDTLLSSGSDYLDGGGGNDTFVVSVAKGSPVAFIDDSQGVNTLVVNGGVDPASAYRVFASGATVVVALVDEGLVGIGDGVDLNQLQVQVTGGGAAGTGLVSLQDIVLAADAGGRIVSGMQTAGGMVDTALATVALTLAGSARGDALNGGSGNDKLNGADASDQVSGGLGNDMLFGGNGADIIIGGAGDDTLFGGDAQGLDDAAGDTFLFALGDGLDRINAAAVAAAGPARNVIRLGPGIAAGNVQFAMNDAQTGKGDGDVVIYYSAVDQVTLAYGAFTRIERIEFDDGSSLSHAQALAALNARASSGAGLVNGTPENDNLLGGATHQKLYGFAGDDVLQGGTGGESLVGGLGVNTYVFDVASGKDVIDPTLATVAGGVSEQGLLQFTGARLSEVSAAIDGFDLVITQASGSLVRLRGYQLAPSLADWHFEDRDGTSLTLGELLAQQTMPATADLAARRAAYLSTQIGQLGTLSQRYDPNARWADTTPTGIDAMLVPQAVDAVSTQLTADTPFEYRSYLNLTDELVTTITRYVYPIYAYAPAIYESAMGQFVPLPEGATGPVHLPNGVTPVYGPPTQTGGSIVLGQDRQLLGYMTPATEGGYSQSHVVGWEVVRIHSEKFVTNDTAVQAFVTGTAGDDLISPAASSTIYPTLFRGSIDTGAGNDVVSLANGANSRDPGHSSRFEDWDAEVPSQYGSVYPAQPADSNTGYYPRGLGAWIDLGAGDDRVSGSDGNDFIVGGQGSDWMDGQAGADTYLVGRSAGSVDHISDLARTSERRQGSGSAVLTTALLDAAANGAFGIDPVSSGESGVSRLMVFPVQEPRSLIVVVPRPPVPAGPANEDTVEFDAGILLGSLSYQWNDAPTGTPDPGFASFPLRALELYQNGQHFLDIDYVPGLDSQSYSKPGIEKFRFADGSSLTLDQLLGAMPDRTLTVPVLAAPFSDVQALEDAALLVALAPHFTARGGVSITFSAMLADGSALPGFMALDPEAGVISGAPGNDDVGAYALQVRAATDAGFTDATFNLRIENVNDAPVVVGSVADAMDPVPVATAVPFTWVLPVGLFNDVDAGDMLTLSAALPGGGALPAWLALNASTRTMSGTRPVGDTSTWVIEIRATDTANASATALVELSYRDSVGSAHITGRTGDDVLYGSVGDDDMNGLAGNDVLTGRAGNDTLTGGAGNDVLDGGTGTDTLVGGTGNDAYVVDVASDVVTERANEGIDTVRASLNWMLGANVENLLLTGSADIDGTGNTLANVLTGNSGANRLDGGGGRRHDDRRCRRRRLRCQRRR